MLYSAVLDALHQRKQALVATLSGLLERTHRRDDVVARLMIHHGSVKALASLAQRHVRRRTW